MKYTSQERKVLKHLSRLGVTCIFFLVISVTYVFLAHLSPLVFTESSTLSFIVNCIGVSIAALILYDLIKSSLTSPGYSTDLPTPIDSHVVCQYCEYYKPNRSHHCSQCNKCVLEMDHHCPWINNCVGLKNKYFFYRFVIWCIFGGLYLSVTLAPTFFRVSIDGWENREIGTFDRAMIKTLFPLGFSVFVVVGILMGFQAYLIVKQMTTLEYLSQKPRKASLCQRVLRIFKSSKINEL